jgi:Putative beta-lactamase-inhibitor-like, PepSY-like
MPDDYIKNISMKKIGLLVLTLMVFAVCNHTQAQLRKIPAEVTEAFKEKYPDTKNAAWKDKITAFQVNYEMEGVKYISKFSSKGEWQQTEKDIEEDALPAQVKDGYGKSKYTEWELKTVSRVENKDDSIQYRLFVRKSSVEKRYLYFDKEGKLIKDAITL